MPLTECFQKVEKVALFCYGYELLKAVLLAPTKVDVDGTKITLECL